MTETLTDFETKTLSMIGADWTLLPDLTSRARAAVDYLVLDGLAERRTIDEAWLDEWRLTEEGVSAVVPEFAGDTGEMVFLNGEPVLRAAVNPEPPKRIGVGSLVRHHHHGEGLVIDHFMWDGDWGGFRIQLLKPSPTSPSTSVTEVSDRADSFELVS